MVKRILSAAIALVVFVPILLYGQWAFTVLVFLMATIGLFELIRMKPKIEKVPIFFSFIMLWFLLLPVSTFNLATIEFTKQNILFFFIMLLLMYTVISKNKFTIESAGFILLAVLYVGVGFSQFIVIRSIGLEQVLFVLFTIWATDTGAYFTGYAIGKHKLWPSISPNKTIEGAIGGIVSAIFVGILFQKIAPFDLSFLKVVLISLLISIFGQMGDLVASAFKRHFKVKDAGHIMPGHGGILDRMDSLIFVMIFLSALSFF